MHILSSSILKVKLDTWDQAQNTLVDKREREREREREMCVHVYSVEWVQFVI